MSIKILDNQYLTAYNYFQLGINTKYGIDYSNVDKIRKWLNEGSLSSTFLYNDQSEYFVSLRAYPFWMANMWENLGSEIGIPIGPFSANETHVKGHLLDQQKKAVKIGSTTIGRHFNNFMDFAPYTKISAFIPYIGFVSLPTNEIMGKTIDFYCQIDFDNGMMTVWLQTADAMISSWNSKIGIDISLNYTNNTEHTRNLYLWAIKSVTGIGGLMGSAGQKGVADYGKSIKMGGDSATGFIGANQHHVHEGRIDVGVNELYNPTSIYLIFEREKPIAIGTAYPSIYGLPLERTYGLSSLSGFTKIGDINFNSLGYEIYNDEISEIVELLKSGVIL